MNPPVILWCQLKLRGKAERTAYTYGTGYCEASAHALDEPPTDSKTKTRTSIFSRCGSIRLCEIVEDRFQSLGWNSDTRVGNSKLELAKIAGFVVLDR